MTELRVLRGEPDELDIAVLVAVTATARTRRSAESPPEPLTAGGWSDRRRLLRSAVVPAPGGWWASMLPR